MGHQQGQPGEGSHSRDGHPHAQGHHHEHDHEHEHGHSHDQGSHQEHEQGHSLIERVREAVPWLHGHSHGEVNLDTALESSERGIWALKVSLLGLSATAIFQVIIVLASGSVSLLADTIHNFADALTAVPLWIAFALGRRAASRRYTYGFGRAEDIAGVIIVTVIFLSAMIAGYESYHKFINPQPLVNVGWVIVAAIIGFLGNEAVAVFRIRVGQEIGSAALVADGHHSRIDGLTSLAVLFGAVGSLAGFPIVDPIVGFAITLAILLIVKDTAIMMFHRVMDAVDPEIVTAIEQLVEGVPGVQGVHDTRVRWLGHRLQAEIHIVVNEDLPTRESHRIVEEVRHALFHAQSRLDSIHIHTDPCGHSGKDAHQLTAHHTVVMRGDQD